MKLKSIFLLVIILSMASCKSKDADEIRIDAGNIFHEMKGGVGASWHALMRDIPLENHKYKFPSDTTNPRGSAWGGNPPLEDTAAWKQVYDHASWLGLDFIRVEIDQRMFEPGRKAYDWDNDEMQALYRILDWCEANKADVFLQRMWGHVGWNAYPGVHPLISAPRSINDFAESMAVLLDHLTRVKKYTCIKYFCINNEPPGGTWGSWWSNGPDSPPVTPAWKAVREKLDSAGIKIPLSGPDWTSMPPFDSSKIDFNEYVGAYDIHSYDGINDERAKIVADWVRWTESCGKPFFLSEIGNMSLGWKGTNPGPKSFAASISNASDIITGMNLGVDGFNRWSFVNRGNLDGQWQLIRTYDFDNKKYLGEILPEKEAYYGYAMVTRFIGKHASVINLHEQKIPEGVKMAALRNTDGKVTVIIHNQKEDAVNVRLAIENAPGGQMWLYRLDQNSFAEKDFSLVPTISYNKKKIALELLPASLTVLSNYYLEQNDNGMIAP